MEENGVSLLQKKMTAPKVVKKRLPPKVKLCLQCNGEYSGKARKYCSYACSSLACRKAERPPKEKLLEEKQTMSLEAMGRKYGVTGNAIKKWLK